MTAALVLVLLGSPSVTGATPQAPRADSIPRCRLAQLRIVFAGGEGAAGTIYGYFNVRNIADTCYLRGYFGVRLLNGKSKPLKTHARHAGRAPDAARHQARTVVIAPDGRAHFTLSYSDVCRDGQMVKAKKLRLTPPGASRSTVVPAHPRGQDVEFAPCHGDVDVYRVFKRKAG